MCGIPTELPLDSFSTDREGLRRPTRSTK
jgi:hypothetical protein